MSRHQLVWPTFRRTIEALCEALDAAWRFFDSVVQRVALDNMRAPPGSTILAIGGSTGVARGTGSLLASVEASPARRGERRKLRSARGVVAGGQLGGPRTAAALGERRNIRATMGSRVMVSLRREHNARAAGVRSCSIVRDARAARAHARRGREARWSGLCSRTARQSKRPTRRSRPALVDVREQVLQMRFRAANRRVSSSWPECYSRLFETRARAGRRFGRGHDAPRTLL